MALHVLCRIHAAIRCTPTKRASLTDNIWKLDDLFGHKMIVGMTDETPKPKCKSWRWTIASVVIFVVCAAGWWFLPRGDARFVGKWEVISYDKDGSISEGRVVLHSNGAADGEFSSFRTKIWHTASRQGNTEVLCLGNLCISLPWGLEQEIVFSVHSVEHDKITLEIDPQVGPVLVLIRLPD